ncbi:hypothetical protein TIFTF001_012060 [Ficus carica]|uniref:Uncharacterized protein n=1 Tax=Ficus carica TaxID=3494 RepID=A0AA87ZSU6_FICCA|nr:hypothetical protein TIFTF001_012060 [Ficus carica]
MAENEELQRRFNASNIFNTPLPSIATTSGSSTQPSSAAANFFQGGFQPTMALTPYSLLHLMPSLYSVVTPQGIASVISNSIGVTAPDSIPSIPVASTGVSIPALSTYIVPPSTIPPQPLYGAHPTKAFNLHQTISNAVSNQVKIMERCMLKALGHPTTYEDLLNEMDQSPFAQAIIDTAMLAKFRTLNFSKFDGTTDPHEHIYQYQ